MSNLAIKLVLLAVAGALAAIFFARAWMTDVKEEIRGLRLRMAATEAELARLRAAAAPPVEPKREPVPEAMPETAAEAVVLPAERSPPITPPETAAKPGFEQTLSEHWLVWLGGVTLALGGAFLVKYAADQGLLGPAVRVSAGVLLGIALAALAHRLSARPEAGSPHVPPALAGAGVSITFASIYAAYGLYDLLAAPAAFTLLAAVAVAAALLSLRHGPFVALLGLLGGFLIPVLVRSGHPSASILFAYLLPLTAGNVALLRWRRWWWLAWVALGGDVAWTLAWMAGTFQPGDEMVLGVFLLAVFGLFALFRSCIDRVPALAGRIDEPSVHAVVTAAACAAALMSFCLVRAAGDSGAAVAAMFALGAGIIAFARRDEAFDSLPAAPVVLSLLVLAAWDIGTAEVFPGPFTPPLPQDAKAFAVTAAMITALSGLGGFNLMWGAARPWRWAVLSSATPVLTAAVVYWRLSAAGIDAAWSAGVLALALALSEAMRRIARNRADPGMEAALGAYAVGVIGALALAATIALEEAWLTVALSLTLPGIAWVHGRLRVAGLRRAALAMAAVVLARLVLNPYIMSYALGDGLVLNWLLYGYGIPALAFAAAAHLFRRDCEDMTTQVLEAGAILFAVLLASLEIHHAQGDGLAWNRTFSLAERALNTGTWLAMAAVLYAVARRSGRTIPRIAGLILLGLATAQAVLLQALFGNPLFTGATIGPGPFNLLLLAFGVPAALYGVHAFLAPPASRRRMWCCHLGLFFALLWLSLAIRRHFAGEILTGKITGQSEQYAYSLAWLAYVGATLAAGLRLRSVLLRRWGLGVLLLVVAKVFLVDMSHLAGIWRALSFLGLGGALVAIGWTYRRFVGDR